MYTYERKTTDELIQNTFAQRWTNTKAASGYSTAPNIAKTTGGKIFENLYCLTTSKYASNAFSLQDRYLS